MAHYTKCDFCGSEHKEHYFSHGEPMPKDRIARISISITDNVVSGAMGKDICFDCLGKFGLEKVATPRGRSTEDGLVLLNNFIEALQSLQQ